MSFEIKCYTGPAPRIEVTDEFIERNRFRLKSPEEIQAHYQSVKGDTMFAGDVYTEFLPWASVKEYYKKEYVEEVDAGKKEPPKQITDIREATQDFLDYLNFGWGKALDQRGISAGRTVEKLGAWLWVLGREDLYQTINYGDLYNPYGMPALIKVSEELGITPPETCYEFAKNKC